MKTVLMTLGAAGVVLIAGCGHGMKPESGPQRFNVAESRPHVCFVNAGTGIQQDAFNQAVSNACEATHVRWTTVQTPDVKLADIVVPLAEQRKRFGPATVLAVYIVSDPELPRLMSVPGQYSLINICSLRNDAPDGTVFEGRLLRILMKALAYAAGVGANQDPICVMYWNSFSVGTLTSTSATYGPSAFFALVEILRAVGTEDIFVIPE